MNDAMIGALRDAPVAFRRRRRRWIAMAVIAVVLVATAGAAWRLWGANGAPSGQFATMAVERGDIEDTTTAVGTLQPLEYVDVGTQVSGQLRKIHVQIGDAVKEKDLLAEIDPTVYLARVGASRAQLLSLTAQLADKQAQFELTRQQFDRQSNLLAARATSEDAYQMSKAALGSATAQVAALKAQIQNTESTLKADEANLSYTRILAPMDGTVVSQTAKQGQTLNANQQAPIVLRIADLSTMTVWSQVSEADIGRLKIGMDVYFTTLGQPDRKWRGTLRQVLPTPEVINNVVLYNALFDVPNSTGELLPQMTVQAFFVSASVKDALMVPAAALKPVEPSPARARGFRRGDGEAGRSGSGRFQVQVLRDDGTVEDRTVEVGLVTRVSAQIVNGLKEGEQVVVGVRNPNQRPAVPAFARSPRLS